MITPSWPKINEVIKQNPGVISYKPYLYLGARNENRVLYDMTEKSILTGERLLFVGRGTSSTRLPAASSLDAGFCGRSLNLPRPPIDGTLQRCRRIYPGKSTSAFWKLTKNIRARNNKKLPMLNIYISSWWFQPIRKNLVKLDHFRR